MTKEEFIAQCTEELKQSLSDLVSKAYNQGVASVSTVEENTPEDTDYDWVDLKLPSGNRWALVTESAYPEDDQYLPTKEEFLEIVCGLYLDVYVSSNNNLWPGLYAKGLNGKRLKIHTYTWYNNSNTGRTNFNNTHHEVFVWIKSDLDGNFERKCIRISLPTIPLEGRPFPSEKPVINYESKYAGDDAIVLYCKKN